MLKFFLGFCFMVISQISVADVFNHNDWDSLLKKTVVLQRNGQASSVNYEAINRESAVLNRYLKSTSAVSQATFDAWHKDEQLAFLINVYNAWTVKLVLSQYPNLESIKDVGAFFQSPWKKEFIPLLGKTRSLDNIEHELIRARYQEPRIHFAVNCASIGCPALRNEAYQAKQLNAQLEQATQRFLSDQQRNRVNGQTLEVSAIFKWYREDFEKGWRGYSSLEQFFSFYASDLQLSEKQVQKLRQGKMSIKYLDYDWRLNRVR